jgi:two-component system LytT family response regulator
VSGPSAQQLSNLARPPGRPLERVVIRDGAQVHVIAMDQIDFIEAQDDYLAFATAGKRLRKQQTLTEIEAQLDRARFVRIHRSFILNLERLVRIEPYAKDSWFAILKDGHRLPMSRTGYARLKELIG